MKFFTKLRPTKNMEKIDIKKYLPKWTKRVFTDMGGRDPLGLSRVSFIITDYLLTGIITQTDRARYYSFYCWALWHIAREEHPQKYQKFVDAFRRREATMALATVSNNPGTSPVGITAARAYLDKGLQTKEINCNFRVLPSNALGGYGQYYAGSLNQLGLIYKADDGIDNANEYGEALAKAFHSVIEKTPYIKKRLYINDHISLKDLDASKQYLTLDALNISSASEERLMLKDLFFGFNDKFPSERTLMRRKSLSHILYMISEYNEKRIPVNKDSLDWDLVFPIYYYDVFSTIKKVPIEYKTPEQYSLNKSLWKQFCLQQFITQALESLMYCVLEIIGSESAGLRIDDLILQILQHEFYSILKEATQKSCKKPIDLLTHLGINDVPPEKTSLRLQKELSFIHPLSEAQIIHMDFKTPQAAAVRAMLILFVTYGKWRGLKHDVGFNYVAAHANNELWAGTLLQVLDKCLDSKISWDIVLHILIEHFIVNQHDRIMYEKRRLDSCWIHKIEERIIKEQDYAPRWRSSRHYNAVSIMSDLGLIDIDHKNNISVSNEGQQLLKRIMRNV